MASRSRFEGRGAIARLVGIALLALAFLVVSANGRYLGGLAGRPAAHADTARPGPAEPGGEAPPVADPSAVRLVETPVRLRHAAARGLAAARKVPRHPPAGGHDAALNGAAPAVAAAVRARERPGAGAHPRPAPATWVVARGPPHHDR